MENYYVTIFTLVYSRSFGTISEIENLIPFERDVYIKLIKNDDERKKEELLQEQHRANARRG